MKEGAAQSLTQALAASLPQAPVGASLDASERALTKQSPSVSGAIQASTQLKLPYSTYPPTFAVGVSQPLAPHDADTTLLGGLHNITYENLGMLGGWYQQAQIDLPNDAGTFLLVYLASYYSSPQAATGAFNDAASAWTHGSATSCTFPGADQCAQVTLKPAYTNADGFPYDGVFRTLTKSNAMFEVGYLLLDSTFLDPAQRAIGDSSLDAMSKGFVSLFTPATPAPTPVSTLPPVTPPPSTPPPVTPPPATPTPPVHTPAQYRLITVRYEKAGTKANLKNSPLRSVKGGAKVILSAYFEVTAADAGLAYTETFDVHRGSKMVAHGQFSHTLDASSPTGTYWARGDLTLPKKTGTYKGTVTISMDGQNQAGSANIKIVKKKH